MSNPLELIQNTLTQQLNPTQLVLHDDSAQHHGHAGATDGMGHYTVEIASPNFSEKSRIDCHRLVYDALGDLMKTHIHALRIVIKQ